MPWCHQNNKTLAGLIIKEECKLADLKEWEFANVRSYVIKELLAKDKE